MSAAVSVFHFRFHCFAETNVFFFSFFFIVGGGARSPCSLARAAPCFAFLLSFAKGSLGELGLGGWCNATEKRLMSILAKRAAAVDGDCEGEEEGEKTPPPPPPPRLSLNSYEMVVAENVIDPEKIAVSFSDIGGVDKHKSEIYELVVLPLLRPDLFRKGNVQMTKGILLYGKPGTGKTMMAKAIAAESHAVFINVKLSVIMNKYFGESNKMVAAVFSIAAKLAPSIIFIDEIDTFLQQRDGDESALGSMKSEFLTMWDGINGDGEGEGMVMVLGATNRPYDVDSAILRRLPRTFEIGLPDEPGRLDILQKMTKDDKMANSSDSFLPTVAARTAGFSGSDLKELVRTAKMEPIREVAGEFSKAAVGLSSGKGGVSAKLPRKGHKIRPVNKGDWEMALGKVQKTGEAAAAYKDKDRKRRALSQEEMMMMMMQAMQQQR